MKKNIISLIIFFILPISVSAHFLETTNNIGAVIHIDPEDDPIINEPATLFFEITDKSGKFSLNDCYCMVSISDSETELVHQTLNTPAMNYIFPSAGIYTIKLSGRPMIENSFNEFALSWDFRVTRTKNTEKKSDSNLQKVMAGLLAAIVLAVVIIFSKQIKHKQSGERR